MLIRKISIFSLIMLLAGCGSVAISKHPVSPAKSAVTPTAAPSAPIVAKAPRSQPEAPPPDDLWERIRENLSWQEIDHQKVDKAVDNYLRQPGYMPMVSERGSLYLYYIVEEVQKRGLPMELALVPLVERTMDP
ncbi:MAG: lytic transglycosylase, partial [Halieaceae bacterium]|nr:lytic transglycosylase [Halieaceae bacterium]